MRRISQSRREGFTLVEVLAAVVVFAFGVLALYRLQSAGVQSNTFSNDLTQAITLAQDRMELLMSLPYNNSDIRQKDNNGDGVSGIDKTVDGSGNPISDGNATVGKFNIYWNVVPKDPFKLVSSDDETSPKRIRIIVRWQRGDRSWHSVSLECIKPDII